jgi:hypothetical protein
VLLTPPPRTWSAACLAGVLSPAASTRRQAFYQHDMSCSNRMILGYSLIVMASFLDRERLARFAGCRRCSVLARSCWALTSRFHLPILRVHRLPSSGFPSADLRCHNSL